MFFFISQWEWIEGDIPSWTPPFLDQLVSCIDLRSHREQEFFGGVPQGVSLFVYNTDVSSPGMLRIGTTDVDEILSSTMRRDIGNRVGFVIDSTRLRDLYWEFLLDKADINHLIFSRPLMPTYDGVLDIPGVGYTKLTEKSRYWEKVLSHIHKIYEKVRIESRAGRLEEDLYRRLLGMWRRKFNISNHELFIPSHLPKEPFIEPRTTITESFTTADSDTLGPDLTWTETVGDIDIVSNQANTQNAAENSARAETDLSSDDHYVSANVTNNVNANAVAVIARFESATEYYIGSHNKNGDLYNIHKKTGAGFTLLGSLATGGSAAAGELIRFEINGSSMSLTFDNVVRLSSITDTAIVGAMRAGIHGWHAGATIDNFEAGDLINKQVTKSWMTNSNSLPSQGPHIFG